MNTYSIKTNTLYRDYKLNCSDVEVYINNKKQDNTNISITKEKPLNSLKNYNETNNAHFDSFGTLPEKLRKYFRYDVKCPVQSAWIEYYRNQNIN